MSEFDFVPRVLATENMAIKCDDCGETGRIKARVSRGDETRYFCHDEEKSCFNFRRGRYFDSGNDDSGQVVASDGL